MLNYSALLRMWDFPPRKSTVSNVVKAVSVALARLINQFVSFPKDDQTAQAKHKFFQMGNMEQSTIGVFDCTRAYPRTL